MSWLSDNWGNVLSAASLLASIAAYFQSQKAADKAEEAARESAASAAKTSEAIVLAKKQAAEATALSHLLLAHQLGSEIETLMNFSLYPAALIRCRDLGKHLAYIIKRWDDAVPKTTLVGLVDSRSQIEQMVEKLQKSLSVSKAEHGRLLRVVQRVARTLSEEHALAEKRGEINA